MKPPVVLITGLGLATPLGATVDETWSALIARRYLADHAEVPVALEGSRAEALAVHVASQALAEAGWTDAEKRDTPLIVGTSKGAIVDWLPAVPAAGYRGKEEVHTICGLWNESTYGLAGVAGAVADRLGLCGSRLSLSAACASGLHALIRGTMLIRNGEAKRVLVVATESSVHPLFLGGFQRLGVLARDGACRPFDSTRTGFLMSEAAAAVTLETCESGRSYATIEKVSLMADAAHLTGVDPHATALRRMLATLLDNRPVDLIHAHATGTEANDSVELEAIESSIDAAFFPSLGIPGEGWGGGDARLSPPPYPPPEYRGRGVPRVTIYSHKGAIGHSLGASGLVAVALNCLSHRHGIVPPNVRTQWPLPTRRVELSSDSIHRGIRRSLTLSAGFGGVLSGVAITTQVLS